MSMRFWGCAVVVAAMLIITGAANAATFTVTTGTDSNDGACTASQCSLRDAIVAADTAGGVSTITVPAGTYKLTIASTGANDPTTGDLDINNSAAVTINGAGSGSTTIDANNVDRAFAVQNGASLTLSGMTIQNGNPSSSSSGTQYGGAIYSDGALSVTGDVAFQDNSALTGEYGGAIYADADSGSTLSLTGATFVRNNALYGGAVALNQPGTASISRSAFTLNNANFEDGGAIYGENGGLAADSLTFTGNDSSYGGAIYWSDGADSPVTVTNSSFAGNAAAWEQGGAIVDYGSSSMTLDSDRFVGNTGGEGGALEFDSSASTPTYTLNGDELDANVATGDGTVYWLKGTLSSSGSSFIGNQGGEYGGGLYADSGGALSLTNVTISGNEAGHGGGIYFAKNTPTSLTNDTIAYNSAGGTQGGGIYDPNDHATTGSGATGVLNTIVADNRGGDCGNGVGTTQFPAPVDAGHNLDGDSSCFGGLGVAGDLVGKDPLLAQAADNGGSVLTDRLESGSPAIDAGTNTGCPATDARGVSRPQGAACDIGAYEVAASQLSASNSAPSRADTGVPFTYTITVTASGSGPSTGTTVTDQLPSGETLYGANPSQGVCTSSGSPAKVTCALGTVAAGKNATVTLLVAEAKRGSVTDTSTATNDEGANVSASATTKIAAVPAGAGGPKATTGGHRHLTINGVKLLGKVNTGGQPTEYFFQYGTKRWLGMASRLLRSTSSKSVTREIVHLMAGTKYFFRLVAANDSGVSYGKVHSFRTKS